MWMSRVWTGHWIVWQTDASLLCDVEDLQEGLVFARSSSEAIEWSPELAYATSSGGGMAVCVTVT